MTFLRLKILDLKFYLINKLRKWGRYKVYNLYLVIKYKGTRGTLNRWALQLHIIVYCNNNKVYNSSADDGFLIILHKFM